MVTLVMELPGRIKITRTFPSWHEAEAFCVERGYLPFDHDKTGDWESYGFWNKQTMSWNLDLMAVWRTADGSEVGFI